GGGFQPPRVSRQMHERQHQGNDVGAIERLTQLALVDVGCSCLFDRAPWHVLKSRVSRPLGRFLWPVFWPAFARPPNSQVSPAGSRTFEPTRYTVFVCTA